MKGMHASPAGFESAFPLRARAADAGMRAAPVAGATKITTIKKTA
jgi:hypothetical protein